MNQEVAPVKYLDKLLVVKDGKLSMKRGHAEALGATTEKSVALDVNAGDYNGYIKLDEDDKYFSSGKLTTESGMLYKQGYIEFAGQLPSDGHAYPAWWLMGRPTQEATNTSYDRSLYGKVYKRNDQWDTSRNSIVANEIASYKYQIPTATYEIDMIEVMQNASRYGRAKADPTGNVTSITNQLKLERYGVKEAIGWYQIESSVHKWYHNGVVGDNLYIIDWATGSVSNAISKGDFATTATDSWTHTIRGAYHDFGSSTKTQKAQEGGTLTYYTGEVSEEARDNLEKQRRYGFSWYTDGVDFEVSLYVYNDDGSFTYVPVAASGFKDRKQFIDANKNNEAAALTDVYSDAKVFNQYMYILFNNNFYSANATSGEAVLFEDLLTAVGLGSLELDYVRVYQEKGKRDIVTKETESFNNNNHFGY